ncbi:MAG: cyclic nucleotide-binding domain-containing protein [Trueperaceae bacterium]|nr:cyclic nucleotide-binding domain-containing protein [Trueperaceae bacterium]
MPTRAGYGSSSPRSPTTWRAPSRAAVWCRRRARASPSPIRWTPPSRRPSGALVAAAKLDPLATLSERLEALTGDDLELMDLAAHLERLEVAPGSRLLAGAGERADDVFLVAHGQVTTWLDVPGRSPVRLETLRGGHLVGDIAFYAGSVPRHAWVVADEATTLFRLTREGLARLTAADPGLAARFHQLAARQLAERVTHLTRLVEALQR